MLQRFLDPATLASIAGLDLVAKTVVDGFVEEDGIAHLAMEDRESVGIGGHRAQGSVVVPAGEGKHLAR